MTETGAWDGEARGREECRREAVGRWLVLWGVGATVRDRPHKASVRLELEVEERLFCLARSSRSDPIQILHQQGEHGQGV